MFDLTNEQIKEVVKNVINFDNERPMTFTVAAQKYAVLSGFEDGRYGRDYNLQEVIEKLAKENNCSYDEQEKSYQLWLERQNNDFFMKKAEKYRDFLLSMMSKLRDMGIKDEDGMMKKLHQEWEDVETAYMSNDCTDRFLKEMKLHHF